MKDALVKEIGLVVAREVEWAASMGRQFGFEFPVEYDFGLAIVDSGQGGVLHLRIDDVRMEYRLAWPWKAAEDEIASFGDHLVRAASQLVREYIDRHMGSYSFDQAQEIRECMTRSNWDKEIATRAADSARTAIYEVT